MQKQESKTSKRTSGATESNAGDNFHVLWTVKKSFGLLNFKNEALKAIVVEGIDRETEEKIDPNNEYLLGVDIAEYFGGTDLKSANRVVVSQLKYSTRQIDKNWTFSELYKGKKSGSLIHRLAQIYKRLLDDFGRDEVLQKMSLKLVSNREMSEQQLKIIKNVQAFLEVIPNPTKITAFYEQCSKNKISLEKLREATKLDCTEFADFVRLLDFEDCGIGSRQQQEIEIIKALHEIELTDKSAMAVLCQKVWYKMMPEALDKRMITKTDLLYWLGTNMKGLFPVSQNFEVLEHRVERKQVNCLIDAILKNDTNTPICLHGEAGIGKSTITQLIKAQFPKHSEVILFDCYGSGSYLNPSDSRHLHKEAIFQICNEMAKKVGSDFLVTNDKTNYCLVRVLKARIAQAIEILKKQNSNAVLVLIVDAADNSITAAEANRTKSFIQDLLLENSYATGFRLIVTTRTHRIPSLKLPRNTTKIALLPFNLEETESHLKYYFPESTEAKIKDFHTLTNGIPRVQSYVLSLKKMGIEERINYLKPNGKTVEDLILGRIVEAKKKLGENGEKIINQFFTLLISLPRPVPLSYIASIANLTEVEIQDLAIDIWHGLILDKQTNCFSFRDEDFENYIRQNYEADDKLYQKIANYFLTKAEDDVYAAVNLGVVLFNAKYGDKLNEIVLEEKCKEVLINPIRKKEVVIARIKLAMKMSESKKDKLTFFKLAFMAADAAKTDKALQDLRFQNFDLLATLGKISIDLFYKSQQAKHFWLAPLNYELAAIYARQGNKEFAEKHLNDAEELMKWRYKQEDKKDFQISDTDIAHGTETYLRLYDSQAAFDWLNRWSPPKAIFETLLLLMDNLLKYDTIEQIGKWLSPLNLRLDAQLIILDKVRWLHTSFFNLDKMADKLLKFLSKGLTFELYLLPKVMSFCELYYRKSYLNSTKIVAILEKIAVELPNSVPTFFKPNFEYTQLPEDKDSEIKVAVFLRKQVLIALLTDKQLTLEDIYPQKLIEENDDDEKRKFDRFYKYALVIYQFRLTAITNNSEKQLLPNFETICNNINNHSDFKWYDKYWAVHRLNFLALALADSLPFLEKGDNIIEDFISAFEYSNEHDNNNISLRIAIAQKMMFISHLKLHTCKILDNVNTLLQKSALPASKKSKYYIQASRIVVSIDKCKSTILFNKAVEAVSDVDIEAHEQIKCISAFAQLGLSKDNSKLAFEFARFVEFCETKLKGYEHFPLAAAIKGIAHLDCATSFAVICRWEHREVAEITDNILDILDIALQKGFINTKIAAALLPLNIHYWKSYVSYIEKLLEKFDEEANSEQKNSFVKNILRDILLYAPKHEQKQTIVAIYKAIEDGRFLNKNLLVQVRKHYDFILHLEEIDSEKKNNTEPFKKDEVTFYEESYLNIDITNTLSLNRATFEQYVNHLKAFVDIDTRHVSFYTFEKALEERLEEWNSHSGVQQWKRNNGVKILKQSFTHFRWSEEINYERLQNFANIFSMNDEAIKDSIIEILIEKIDEFSSTAIYQTMAFLKNELNQSENENLLRWVLSKSNVQIKDNFADEQWNKSHNITKKPNKVIANTLRFVLGHPDKRIRWRGIHALRRLIKSGNTKVLKQLLEQQNESNCYPFQHKAYTFFWISAKLYLWICIAKISSESPEKLVALKDTLFEEAKNKELPHVLILYFTKQTCLNLYEYDESFFSKKELKTINKLLVSQLKPIKVESLERKNEEYSKREQQWQFDFNRLDTLGYWYESLAKCFGLTEYDVADIADRYICEKWGYSKENTHKNTHVDYYLTSHRQGSFPTIETLERYYEYHAMYCAASDLLKRKPLLNVKKDDYYSWSSWLESKGATSKKRWLSDFRDAVPLDNKFWISEFDKFDKKWRENITDQHYDETLGLFPNLETKTIIPFANYIRCFGEKRERVTITSAIVSPKTSEALLRAVQSVENDFYYNTISQETAIQINEKGFQLLAWLKKKNLENEVFNKKDTFANHIDTDYILFGNEVEKLFKINYCDNFKTASHKGQEVFTQQIWNNTTENRRYDELESEGILVKIDKNFILNFLKKRKMSLIIECKIVRHLETYDFKNKKSKNNSKLYLIHANGKVKTLRGRNYQIGQKDC